MKCGYTQHVTHSGERYEAVVMRSLLVGLVVCCAMGYDSDTIVCFALYCFYERLACS